jgi:hypothetical protein
VVSASNSPASFVEANTSSATIAIAPPRRPQIRVSTISTLASISAAIVPRRRASSKLSRAHDW